MTLRQKKKDKLEIKKPTVLTELKTIKPEERVLIIREQTYVGSLKAEEWLKQKSEEINALLYRELTSKTDMRYDCFGKPYHYVFC